MKAEIATKWPHLQKKEILFQISFHHPKLELVDVEFASFMWHVKHWKRVPLVLYKFVLDEFVQNLFNLRCYMIYLIGAPSITVVFRDVICTGILDRTCLVTQLIILVGYQVLSSSKHYRTNN